MALPWCHVLPVVYVETFPSIQQPGLGWKPMNGNNELNRWFPHLKSQQQSFITPRAVGKRTAVQGLVTCGALFGGREWGVYGFFSWDVSSSAGMRML